MADRARRNVAYFVNWSIYGRNYQPQDIPVDQLSHILYAFANIRADSGEVFLTDSWSDVEKHYPTDSWNDTGNNVYGCAKQLYLLKKRNRALKVLLSIGGWTYSSNFAGPASSEAGRTRFAESAVGIVKDLGFDGIDIDWEYPQNEQQANDLVSLLHATRTALDGYTARHGGQRLLLTVASPAGSQNYSKMHLGAMAQVLDFFNLMAYDYAGSWDRTTGHQSNWYPSQNHPAATPFSTDAAVRDHIAAGVPAHQIVIGMPLYGRAFESTEGLGEAFSGVGEGSWENGVWDYKALPRPGAVEKTDEAAVASYCYNPQSRTMVTYDTVQIAEEKMRYIKQQGLGGAMFWELSGDRRDDHSLVAATYRKISEGGNMDQSENTLHYPDSKYDNIKNGMPES